MHELPPAGGTSTPSRELLIDLRNASDPNETMLSLSDAAQRIDVDRTTLLRYIKSGRIKGEKVPGLRGEQWMVPLSAIAPLERQPEVTAAPPSPPAPESRVLDQLSQTMERLIGELTQQRIAITAGEERLADEREQRVRMEERLASVQREHELALEVARREAAAIEKAAQEGRERAEAEARAARERAELAAREAREQAEAAAREAERVVQAERERLAAVEAERAEALAREAALREWAATASKRRLFRKPPPPPTG